MKILYELPDGSMIASEVVSILSKQDPDSDRWVVLAWRVGNGHPDIVARDLTEKAAKNIVRKLFDYGVYTGV